LYALGGALLCEIISLSIGEISLGFILAWCALVAIIMHDVKVQRRFISFISPTIIGIIFTVWRAYHALQINDTTGYVIKSPITFKSLFTSFVLGFKVLIWGWTEPIRYLFGYHDNILPLLFLGLSILILMFGTFIALNIKGFNSSNLRPFLKFSRSELMTVCILFIVGVILVIAGYIPVILMFIPNLSGTLTRVNTFASIGASIALVAMVNMGALILGRNRMQVGVIMGITVIPFIVLGAITQVWVQQSTQVAWLEQKQIWRELLNISPGLAEGTTVYLVLPGYKDRVGFSNWRHLPLMGDWDATGALNVLYNDASLHGDVIYPDIETPTEPTLTDKGIVHYWKGKVTPYDQALFVIFTGNPKHLKVVTDLQAVLSVSWPTPNYMPYQHILTYSPPVIELRRLVDQ
jgi:hypothetical protein